VLSFKLKCMFENKSLDVFIGLVFIFLLYSLFATIIQEMIASRFGLRARMLQKALRRMLDDGAGNEDANAIENWFAGIGDDLKYFFSPFANGDSLLKKFYNHPSVKYLGEGKLFRKPSYLHAHNFSHTLIQLLRGDDFDGVTESESELVKRNLAANTLQINPQTLKQLNMLFADARQDTNVFRHKLEDWFEETMERTTGWYKKQNQVILVIIGLALAASFNVDTIAITKILLKDKTAREQIVQLAINRQKDYGQILDSVKTVIIRTEVKIDSVTRTIDSVVKSNASDQFLDSVSKSIREDAVAVQGILGLNGIPAKADSSSCRETISLLDSAIAKETDPVKKEKIRMLRNKAYECCLQDIKPASPYQTSGFLKWIGWIITALAISLGAPFWFDLLNKFIKLRGSGPKVTNMAAMDKPGAQAPGVNAPVDNNNNDIRG
jgi:hypothetical protein